MNHEKLTVMLKITDKDKANRLWTNHMDRQVAREDGYQVKMLSWGDAVGEGQHVLDRIQDFFSGPAARERVLKECDPTGSKYGRAIDLDTFGEMVQDWIDEARTEYGEDMT